MKRFSLLLICWLVNGILTAQSLVVPTQMKFANLQLVIDEEARAKIQKKVNEITGNAKYYQVFVERAETYFPIIERVFREENLPDDFKYLALLESALLPDAVSRSRAVGFWQLKDTTARELGLQINDNVDERKHLYLATKGVAAYMHKQNYFMRNWLYTLLSYRLGLTGANSIIDRSLIGAEKISINNSTHIYIIHYLAYLAAFRDRVMPAIASPIRLIEYKSSKGQKLEDIAKKASLPYEKVRQYNSWLKNSSVPEDKDYTVFIPAPMNELEEINQRLGLVLETEAVKKGMSDKKEVAGNGNFKWGNNQDTIPKGTGSNVKYPILLNRTVKRLNERNFTFVRANGIDAMIADENDLPADLANAAGISKEKFLKYNELTNFDNLKKGQIYYLDNKRSKADVPFHVLQENESLWDVSQKYGIKVSSIAANNRLGKEEVPQPGRVLWLQNKRPKKTPVEVREVEKQTPAVIATTTGDTQETPVERTPDPVTEPAETSGDYHLVRDGETLYSVSQLYGVTIQELKQWNDLGNNLALEAGQRIKVKGERIVQPAETTTETTGQDKTTDNKTENQTDNQAGTQTDNQNQQTGGQDTQTGGNNVSIGQPQDGNTTTPLFTPAEEVTHEVKYGETLFGIARTYKVSPDDLRAWNNLDNTSKLSIGQKITVRVKEGSKTEGNTVAKPPRELTNPVTNNTVTNNTTGTNNNVTNNTATNTTTTEPVVNTGVHIVQKGETLSAIARRYQVAVADLFKWNNLGYDSKIEINQQILVRQPETMTAAAGTANTATTTTPGNIHIVQPGESLSAIARKYNVTLKDLFLWNNMDVNTKLEIGQQVKVQPPVNPAGTGTEGSTGTTGNGGTTGTTDTGAQFEVVSTIHEVKMGETMKLIAQRYGVQLKDLLAWNNMAHDTKLDIGQKVIVKPPVNTAGTGAATGIAGTATTSGTGAESATETIMHEVEIGQTMKAIAQKYGVQLKDLLDWNNMAHDTKLDIGQKVIVKVPVATAPPDTGTPTGETTVAVAVPDTHKVQFGETLFGISRKYGIPLNDLLTWNALTRESKLETNQVLVLKAPAQKPVTSGTSQTAEPARQGAAKLKPGKQPNGDYVISPKETVYDIVDKFGISIPDFKKWNNISVTTDALQEGRPYIISAERAAAVLEGTQTPPGTANPSDQGGNQPLEVETTVYHTVAKGETLFSIARKYNVKVFDLKSWNNLTEDTLKEGQKLVISKQ